MKTQWKSNGQWSCVKSEEALLVDVAKNRADRCKMVSSLDKSLYVHVMDANTAADVWKILKNPYQDFGLERRIGLVIVLQNNDLKCIVFKLSTTDINFGIYLKAYLIPV